MQNKHYLSSRFRYRVDKIATMFLIVLNNNEIIDSDCHAVLLNLSASTIKVSSFPQLTGLLEM